MQDIIPGTDLHRPPAPHPCWNHYCQLARGSQGCPPWPVGLLEPWWCHDNRDGILLHGEAILIPTMEREEFLCWIHEGHQGITKCQLCTQNCVYWLGINKEIQYVIKACETCQCFRPWQPCALLNPTLPSTQPWQHIGTDLFEFNQHEYLVLTNYYSHMPIIWKVPHGQCNSSKVISLLKEIFSKHGSPETLVCDNGPQHASTAFAEFVDEWKFTHMTSTEPPWGQWICWEYGEDSKTDLPTCQVQ